MPGASDARASTDAAKMKLIQEALNDPGLIALLSQTEEELEEHGESNQPNLLLRDFVRELLRYRLLG